MKLNAEYVVYLDANAAQVTVEDKSDPTAETHPHAIDSFQIATVADLLSAFAQLVIDCRACPCAVHSALLCIPEYRAAVPLDANGSIYTGYGHRKDN